MGSVKEYFSSLGTGISSLIKGMGVTGKEFFTPKVTESYPDSRKGADPSEPRYQQYAAPRFRAKLQFIYLPDGRNRCTACGTCQRNCPNGTITITTKMVDLPDGKKKRKLDKYMYDLGSCTFCELCVTTCPFDAIEFSNDFEQCLPARNLCSSSTISPSSRAIPHPRLLPQHPRQPLPHLRPRPPRLLQPNPKRKKIKSYIWNQLEVL